MVLEVLVDVAAVAAEDGDGLRPAGWVGRAGGDVGGDGGPGEEVDFYGLGCPFHGVDAAADGVESCAVASGVGGAGAAAYMAALSAAVTVLEFAG